ncbi:AAA family ATPase [Nocardia sp. NPDC127579]|uniref:AAA family ATPase n=1 Tax=Nocardia sp. NPDC127579 TaxID=3345402 RepID=UPI003628650C
MPTRHRQPAGALPEITNGFVGRGPELDRIRNLLLSPARLITLTGMGGIGKTRLAAEAIGQFRKATRAPVHWVRLARLAKEADFDAVEDEVAHAVLDADYSGRSAWDALLDKLTAENSVGRGSRAVVVMDNCEHVLATAASFIAALLEAAPRLVIVATSREPVGWVDEHLVEVPPLSRQQALTLFLQRAELTGHAITGAEQMQTAEQICQHMHNHPLYLQLAAARLRRQPLATILRELSGGANDQRMRWSQAWRVGTDTRHQRVTDVIAWSYDLCTEQERLLLARMSVFAAGHDANPEKENGAAADVGADLEAIEVVCADPDDLERTRGGATGLTRGEIEGLLERLVDQSLVTPHRSGTSVRYSLLETIRVFAYQRLQELSDEQTDEPARIATRHRQYYRDKVVQAYADWYGLAELERLNWARASWDNILVAIEGSLTVPDEAALGLTISVGLIALRLPFFNGSLREARQWAERTLEASRSLVPQPTELQVTGMGLIGWIATWQGQNADTERMLEGCAAACLDDPEILADWRQNAEIDLGLPHVVEFVWGQELMLAHRDPAAIVVLGRAKEKSRRLGDLGGAAMGGLIQAMAATFLGTAEQALEIARHNVEEFTAAGPQWLKSWAEVMLAFALAKHGDPNASLAVGRQALRHLVSIRDPWGAGWAIHVRCWALARIITEAIAAGDADAEVLTAQATETARLLGGARRVRAELGTNIEALRPFADETDRAAAVARGVLGAETFAVAENEGFRLRYEAHEIERLALGTLVMDRVPAGHTAETGTASRWDDLTRAEQAVAAFAAAGWTNSAIAAQRGSSLRTVDAQMASVLQKLVITSREEVIRFVPVELRDQTGPPPVGQPPRGGARPSRRRNA